eukprot:1168851-Pyramimonas_sp.AAC.1
MRAGNHITSHQLQLECVGRVAPHPRARGPFTHASDGQPIYDIRFTLQQRQRGRDGALAPALTK